MRITEFFGSHFESIIAMFSGLLILGLLISK